MCDRPAAGTMHAACPPAFMLVPGASEQPAGYVVLNQHRVSHCPVWTTQVQGKVLAGRCEWLEKPGPFPGCPVQLGRGFHHVP